MCPAELGFVWRATTRMKAAAGGGPACLLPSPPGSGEARGTKPAGKKGARSWRGVLRRAGAGADGSSAGSTAGEGFLQKEAAFPPFSRRLNPRRAFRASQTLPGVQTMLLSGGVEEKIPNISCSTPAAFAFAGFGRGEAGAQVPFQDQCNRTAAARRAPGTGRCRASEGHETAQRIRESTLFQKQQQQQKKEKHPQNKALSTSRQ